MPNLIISNVQETTFQWYVSALSSPWTSSNYRWIALTTGDLISNGTEIPPSGLEDSVYPPPSGSSTSTPIRTVSGMIPGKTYKLYASAKSTNEKWYRAGSATFTMKNAGPPRPSNFYWSSTVASGYPFRITAYEWNSLTSRINSFRAYKGLSSYSFTTAPYGDGRFYAFMYNQAVTAISHMNPPIWPPSSRNSGDLVYARDLNDLVSSLNSI